MDRSPRRSPGLRGSVPSAACKDPRLAPTQFPPRPARTLPGLPELAPHSSAQPYLSTGGGSAGSGTQLAVARGGGGGDLGRHGPLPSAPLSARPPPAAGSPSSPRRARSRPVPAASGLGGALRPLRPLARAAPSSALGCAATVCSDVRPLLPTHPAAPVS